MDVISFVNAAVLHRDISERLRLTRATLAHSRWWPFPERRPVIDEVTHLTDSVEVLSRSLQQHAADVAVLLVQEAAAQVRSQRHDQLTYFIGPRETPVPRPALHVDSDPVLVEQVWELLSTPGREPLPATCAVGLTGLPALIPHLNRQSIERLVHLCAAG